MLKIIKLPFKIVRFFVLLILYVFAAFLLWLVKLLKQ